MTLTALILGWLFVIAGGVMVMRPGGLGVGVCGAVILGAAYAGAFN